MVAAVACAAVAVVVAAGYGYAAITATNNTYTGCLVSGSITNVAIGSGPTKPCQKPSQQISWSQTGPPGQDGTNGKDGVSVTSATEPPGANCANGGSKFTAANGVTYACNGAKGDKGDKGEKGEPGTSGTDGTNGTNGTNGTDGVSVTSAALSAADSHCPHGGSSFTSVSGTAYACNGADGQNGSGLSSINDLNGKECGTGLTTGTVSLSYEAASGEVKFHCNVTSGQMHLVVSENAGATTLWVDNVFGLGVAFLTIDSGDNAETNIVQAIGNPGFGGTGVLLYQPLTKAHAAGTLISFHS
jgi:hypothetical protein